jgi:5-methylcytosine-specific restriction endonuclease McrBC regulatory subunit McrC
VFERGLEAIEWTMDERGLAGLGELSGLPWRLPMDAFFEAWVETVAERYCTLRGGALQTGREHETVVPLSWDPPYFGSQSSLRPDFVIDKGDQTIILDAKYKSHWEELDAQEWHQTRRSLRDQHRTDLLQVLAYANLADVSRVTTCLMYPCHHSTWESLAKRDRLAHKAELGAGSRTVELVLAAVSMETSPDEAVRALEAAVSE